MIPMFYGFPAFCDRCGNFFYLSRPNEINAVGPCCYDTPLVVRAA